MSSRTKIILVLGSVVLLAVGWVVFRNSSEPSYGGLTLSQWVESYDVGDAWSTNQLPRADEAMRKMGSSAIPFLLDWMSYQCPDWWPDWFDNIGRLNQLLVKVNPRCSFEYKIRRANAAHFALVRLGPMSIPGLAQLLTASRSPSVRHRAMMALNYIPGGNLALIATLTNKPPVDLDEMKSFIMTIQNEPILPVFAGWLSNSDERVALMAVNTIPDLLADPGTIRSVLVPYLEDPRPAIRLGTSNSLHGFNQRFQFLTNSH